MALHYYCFVLPIPLGVISADIHPGAAKRQVRAACTLFPCVLDGHYVDAGSLMRVRPLPSLVVRHGKLAGLRESWLPNR
ncbi:hypothetical protein O9992_09480 [Vibrio lentus]|nr:hypothetical protein [Vibrio lentus]